MAGKQADFLPSSFTQSLFLEGIQGKPFFDPQRMVPSCFLPTSSIQGVNIHGEKLGVFRAVIQLNDGSGQGMGGSGLENEEAFPHAEGEIFSRIAVANGLGRTNVAVIRSGGLKQAG